jgi:WD40 repeat protein
MECGSETYAVCGSEDGAVMTWNLQTGEEAQRIAGSMDAWEHVRDDEKRAKAAAKAKGAGSPGTPERTTEEKKEGSDAMDVDGDEDNAAAKDGDGDGSEDANDGEEEEEDEPSPPPPTDPSGHGDAVVGLDFLNGMLATSGLERDRTIKLWTTSAYRSQHA